jgi:hypothetical protein
MYVIYLFLFFSGCVENDANEKSWFNIDGMGLGKTIEVRLIICSYI